MIAMVVPDPEGLAVNVGRTTKHAKRVCKRDVRRRNERRVDMATKIAHFPHRAISTGSTSPWHDLTRPPHRFAPLQSATLLPTLKPPTHSDKAGPLLRVAPVQFPDAV